MCAYLVISTEYLSGFFQWKGGYLFLILRFCGVLILFIKYALIFG